ncbi:MAG: trimethylamine methyltransferase family protein [Rhodospirillales bacterium]|nr:trimethylamine methyltransferase family protein [Rhodospirillales bacterium]MBT4627914.1 trimethylamine methyltransferase family protein [Rhodospirillales bacterium]MBT5351520.1 trimethylamine methyltransferase family protein [Rhodospirillales bacterium]MBT6111333.1 trimethylamine methyltransferase family protein [Rhodospirillales bacterium]MBT6825048.1 trimethylamine methyltransferase family protein [Rhodospirillales bacterium]
MTSTKTRKSRGRKSRRVTGIDQTPPAPYIQRQIATYDILNEEGLCLIEENAETILQETGMEFVDDPEILEIFRDAGADVQGTRVRFEHGMCRGIIRSNAPAEYTQYARNLDKSVQIGGNNTVLAPGWGPPFVHDLDHGRRYGTLDDFQTFIKIHHMIPHLHHSGGVVCEPVELPANKRHLDMLYSHIKYSDRCFMGAFIGEERATDAVNMAKILFGDDFVADNCVLYNVANTNAPLVMDAAMSGSLKVYARNNQTVAVTPWTLAGAMSPCTVAGTLAQVLAEALAGLALVQLIKPGAPCLMGSFASTISMQSGAPTFGTPESGKLVLAAGQLARRLGVPFHTVGALSASKIPDAQSQQEATYNLMMSVLAGANFINHATGWLEGGLVNGLEKTIIDADLCGNIAAFAEGIDLSDNAQAMDAIREVGPGNHFLGSAHTQENFKTAFYRPQVADANSYEQWQADGELDAAQRANKRWKQLLEEYEQPPLDPAIDEALLAYIAKRKESMPDLSYI